MERIRGSLFCDTLVEIQRVLLFVRSLKRNGFCTVYIIFKDGIKKGKQKFGANVVHVNTKEKFDPSLFFSCVKPVSSYPMAL